MWWKLAGVWLTTALIGWVLLLPVKTHTVKLDMPAGTSTTAAEHTALIITIVAVGLGALICLGILAIPFWISWRIIRSYKESK
jgi:hypothetical protein